MLSRLVVALGAFGLVTGGLALGTPAQADVRVGVMTCDMDSGFGYVLGSSRDLHCTSCRRPVLRNIMPAPSRNSALISDTCKTR